MNVEDVEAGRMNFPDTLKQQVDEIFAKLTPKEQGVLSRYVWLMTVQAHKEGEQVVREANRRAVG
jgi:hypothetical protein